MLLVAPRRGKAWVHYPRHALYRADCAFPRLTVECHDDRPGGLVVPSATEVVPERRQ